VNVAAALGADPCPAPTEESGPPWLVVGAEARSTAHEGQITITRWGDVLTARDLRPKDARVTLTWSELVAWLSVGAPRPPGYIRACSAGKPKDAADLAAWSPAVFEHGPNEDTSKGLRQIPNVVHVTAVVADIDAGAHSLDTIRGAFAGRRAIVHSTRSFTHAAPTWRVVSALSRPTIRDEHAPIWRAERDRLAGLGIAVDEKTKDPSRLYFSPVLAADGSYIFAELDGKPLVVDDALECDAIASELPRAPASAERSGGAPGGQAEARVSPARVEVTSTASAVDRISIATRKRRAEAWIARADASVSGARGHDDAMRVASAVVQGFALGNSAEAREVLAAWNARCVPPWSHAELEHKIAEAARVGRHAWAEILLRGDLREDDAPSPAPGELPTAEDPLRGCPALAKVAVSGRAALLDLAARRVRWAWEDIAVESTIVLLAGGPGEGKTTLLFLLLAARLTYGDPIKLLGRTVVPARRGGRIVLIEGEHTGGSASRKLARSLEMLGIDDACLDRLILIARKAVVIGSPEWLDVVRMVKAGLVSDIAIDTIARVAPADANDERDQVRIADSVAQAIDAADDDAHKPIAWIIAHTRKGAGDSLDDVGGSTQRVGQADTVLMMKATKGEDGRVLASTATFRKIREEPDNYPSPVTWAIERDPTTGKRRYVEPDGTADDDDTRPLPDRVLSLLAPGSAMTRNALAKATGRSGGDIDTAISTLFQEKRIERVETKARGRTVAAFTLREEPSADRVASLAERFLAILSKHPTQALSSPALASHVGVSPRLADVALDALMLHGGVTCDASRLYRVAS
jgi:hypothetical protein